jgi:hypothetical protein
LKSDLILLRDGIQGQNAAPCTIGELQTLQLAPEKDMSPTFAFP